MHIPARPRQDPILTRETPGAALEARLWERLAPEHWPLSPCDLPPGTALVGGAVRDALLGRLAPQPDLDLVVPGEAITLARHLARRLGGSCVVLDPDRDMARLVLQGWTVDLARREGSDLASDLWRRDYSANAIALPLEPGAALVDPTGGLAALERRELVAVRESNLLDDPVRLLRGIRLAAELELELEATSLSWIGRHAAQLGSVAGERVLSELERLAAAPQGQRGMQQALDLTLLQAWGADPQAGATLTDLSPEAAATREMHPAESAWALPLARLACVLPPEAVDRLRGSRWLQQRCGCLRRWWERLGAEGSRDLAALAEEPRLQLHRELEADLPALLLGLPVAGVPAALQRWRDGEDRLFHPRAPLNGHALSQALGLAAGPELGALLQHLTRERAFGRIAADGPAQQAAALQAAREWLSRRRG
jgi:tRNA nucleotidyltransferase (CCA-adding enzyme)